MRKELKKSIALIIVVIITIVLVFTIIDILRRVQQVVVDDFPGYISVLSIDSIPKTISFYERDTTMVYIFNSECEICIISLEELLQNYTLFENFRIILLSSQDAEELAEVIESYKLLNFPGIQVYRKDALKTHDLFTNAPNPSVFVFVQGGNIIYAKKGYKHPQVLLKEIRE